MQQNGEKCNSLSAFDQREVFFFFLNSRWISEGQCYTHSVCFLVSVFSWFRGKLFSPFDPREKTHTNTSQCHKHCKSGPFLWTSQLKSAKGLPLAYQHSKRIWNAAQLLHANPSQLLWELRLGHSCLGKFRAQHTPHPSSPTSSETRRSTLTPPSDFWFSPPVIRSTFLPSLPQLRSKCK